MKQRKIVKVIAIRSVLVLTMVAGISYVGIKQSGKSENNLTHTVAVNNMEQDNQEETWQKQAFDKAKGKTVDLPFAKGLKKEDIHYTDDCMKKLMTITLPEKYYSSYKDSLPSLDGVKMSCKINNKKTQIELKFSDYRCCLVDFTKYSMVIKYGLPKEMFKKVVVIDPGHGGQDNGCGTYNLKHMEKDIALDVCNKVIAYSKDTTLNNYKDDNYVKFLTVRQDDTNYSCAERIAFANKIKADLFLSVHCNSVDKGMPTGSGPEVMYDSTDKGKGMNSKKLAKILRTEYLNETNLDKRVLLDGKNLIVLKKAKITGCLLELGFLSSKKDSKFLISEQGQEKAALAIFNALKKACKEK